MNFSAIIFDLDGTLLNTADDIADSVNLVLKREGFPPHSVDDYKRYVGDGVSTLVERVLPKTQCDAARIARVTELVMAEYDRHGTPKTLPYDGIVELLERLDQLSIRKAIFSNKPQGLVELAVEKYFAKFSFEIVCGAGEKFPKKPDPAGAIDIASEMDLPANEFIFLGDSGIDMMTAIGAGMHPVGALWGFRGREELISAGAEIVFDNPSALIDRLKNRATFLQNCR